MTAQLLPSGLIPPAELATLRARLDRFYAEASTYTAFQTPSDQRNCWDHVLARIRELLAAGRGKVRVLEVGAGRTGFALFLEAAGLRGQVELHTQDVTRYNEDWLRTQAEHTHFGDVHDCPIPSGLDLVFSTYVFEHVTDPAAHLERLWSLLAPSGSLLIFSPRYDLPGYLCPSARHLPGRQRLGFVWTALRSRLACLFGGTPRFLIQTDLAAFHQPFYLDSDAVHWVSTFDLKTWAGTHRATFQHLAFGHPRPFGKDWIIKRLCTTAVRLDKTGAP